MKNKILSIFVVAPLLMACGNNLPQKGYDKFKKMSEEVFYRADPTSNGITWQSCSYMHIASGERVDPLLKDTCWYTVHCILHFINGSYVYDTEYGIYADSDGSVAFATAVAINNISSLLNSGAIKGSRGTL